MYGLFTKPAMIAKVEKPCAGVVVCGCQAGMAQAPHAINPRDAGRQVFM